MIASASPQPAKGGGAAKSIRSFARSVQTSALLRSQGAIAGAGTDPGADGQSQDSMLSLDSIA